MTNNAQLLPLPEPTFKQVGIEQGTNRRVQISNYTAEQMQSYALACIEAAKPTQTCNYPDCKCPTENPCLKGLPADALGSLPVVAWHVMGELEPTGKFHLTAPTTHPWFSKPIQLIPEWQANEEIAKRDVEIKRLRAQIKAYQDAAKDSDSLYMGEITTLRAKLAGVDGLVDALKDLLADTQHSTHNCGDKFCPVDRARAALATYEAAQSK